jgi:DNA repair protein RecO (recombination protein O)
LSRVDRAPAFVLHRRAWRDTSLILELFCPGQGRVAAIARGVRSPRSKMFGLTEPFRELEASWTRRGEMGTLTGLEPIAPPSGLRGRALLCGLYANELLLRLLPRDDPEPDVYQAYRQLLPRLVESERQAGALRGFELVLLDAIGILPDFSVCAESGDPVRSGARYRVAPGAGVEPCRPGQQGIDGELLLALATRAPLPAQSLPAVRTLMRELIDQQLDGRPLQTPALLREYPT